MSHNLDVRYVAEVERLAGLLEQGEDIGIHPERTWFREVGH